MGLTNRVRNAVRAFTTPEVKAKNSTDAALEASNFLRYGSRQPMYQDWTVPEMTDIDFYSGYGYGVINRRANRAVTLGKSFLYTKAADPIVDAAKEKGTKIEHPYLPLIYGSTEFTETDFWFKISRYLDLEGRYYLMAVRTIGAEDKDGNKKVGHAQKFVMLNPYNVHRVKNQSTGEFGGYIETRGSRYREIPKEQIIEIMYENPVKDTEPYGLADASQEAQFTLKQSGDYTRHSIQENLNAPGIISTDVELDDYLFDDFKARVRGHSKGEPLFGNGSGAITWQSMQIDLDKAALATVEENNRQKLFSASAVSNSLMGVEKSGTGRETSKVNRDEFTENAIMPQVNKILDALNLDYRKYHYEEWKKNQYEIALANPLESDYDATLKQIDVQQKELEVSQQLIQAGYEEHLAYQFAKGEIDIEGLGQPTLEPELTDQEAYIMALREAGATDEEIRQLTGANGDTTESAEEDEQDQEDKQDKLAGVEAIA